MKGVAIRKYLFAGLVLWLPVLATLWILSFIVDLLDKTMSLLPKAYQPEQLFGMHIPGLGVVVSLIILLATGIIATNYLGQRLVIWSELILERIPLVRSIYNASKQVINAIFSSNSNAFRKVLLIEYPRKGLWSIAFQTSVGTTLLNQQSGEEMVCVYVPTTPNPTSGFLLMLSRKEVIELNITIDEALKYTISLGVMQPSISAVDSPRN